MDYSAASPNDYHDEFPSPSIFNKKQSVLTNTNIADHTSGEIMQGTRSQTSHKNR